MFSVSKLISLASNFLVYGSDYSLEYMSVSFNHTPSNVFSFYALLFKFLCSGSARSMYVMIVFCNQGSLKLVEILNNMVSSTRAR